MFILKWSQEQLDQCDLIFMLTIRLKENQ